MQKGRGSLVAETSRLSPVSSDGRYECRKPRAPTSPTAIGLRNRLLMIWPFNKARIFAPPSYSLPGFRCLPGTQMPDSTSLGARQPGDAVVFACRFMMFDCVCVCRPRFLSEVIGG